jgi:DNA-binding NarL/FixJ family response regulator
MSQSPNDNDDSKKEPLFRRPVNVLLNEKQWLFLKERYHMTPREMQVAILVCRGFDNDEIAAALKMKYGTVKTHLRNIYRRVRVKSKITLLLRFLEDINTLYSAAAPASRILKDTSKI